MKRLPFVSPARMREILSQCTRTDDGCLLYQPDNPERPRPILINGEYYNVVRLMWAEHYAFTRDAETRLSQSLVLHIAECPNTGDIRGGRVVPLCIEPTHLRLGDAHDCGHLRLERKEGLL